MSESSKVVSGGTSVATAAPVEKGEGGTLLEDAPRETTGSESAKDVIRGSEPH